MVWFVILKCSDFSQNPNRLQANTSTHIWTAAFRLSCVSTLKTSRSGKRASSTRRSPKIKPSSWTLGQALAASTLPLTKTSISFLMLPSVAGMDGSCKCLTVLAHRSEASIWNNDANCYRLVMVLAESLGSMPPLRPCATGGRPATSGSPLGARATTAA